MKHQQILRRTQTINNTKIQYLSAADKIYKVKNIDFGNLIIEAMETDLSIADIPEDEVFSIEDFGEFRVRLISRDGGMGETPGDVIHFGEWARKHRKT